MRSDFFCILIVMDRFIIFYTGVFLVKWVSGWGNQPSGTERIGSIFFVTPVFLWTKLINVSGRNLFLKRSKVVRFDAFVEGERNTKTGSEGVATLLL
jgi:hypothetical protein